MNFIKKQNAFGWAAAAAAVLAVTGMIFYIVTSVSGYMAGQTMSSVPVILTIIGVVVLIAAVILAGKLDGRIIGGLLAVADVLIAIALCVFVNTRVLLFADVYFIPVNYPVSEGTALNLSIVGFVFYVLSLVCTVFAGFGEKLVKSGDKALENA